MKPNNRYTTPEQRFFFPINGEAECHESFDRNSVPHVEAMPGACHYVVAEMQDGDNQAILNDPHRELVPGGVIVKQIVGHNDYYGYFVGSVDEISANSQAVYEPAEGDTLILKPGSVRVRSGDKLLSKASEGWIAHPAHEPLPYLNSKEQDEAEGREASYSIVGVIKLEEASLLSFGAYGQGARYLVDLAAANAVSANGVEHSLVVDELGTGGGRSLKGSIACNEAAQAYLGWYDFVVSMHQPRFLPEKDPERDVKNTDFGELSKAGLKRVRQVLDARYGD